MRGLVVHYQGKVKRALEGRGNDGRLDVKVVTPVPVNGGTARLGRAAQRPVYFIFNFDGRPFAASKNVRITNGRRYPNVEHWFIGPERERLMMSL